MGCGAVMANTAIATASDVPAMATAFRMAIEAGRLATLAKNRITSEKGVDESIYVELCGQQQRILIGRAIINKPAVLILDEATSALDNITQKKVIDTLAGLKATKIVVAHRLSTVIQCDRILVMESGRIVEEGSYSQLMDKRGYFYQLASRQSA